MMRTVCIYHSPCWDGLAAAWVVSKMYPDAEFVPMGNYREDIIATTGGDIVRIDKGIRLIIVDYSFPRERMIALHKNAGSMIVLDHHKSAEQDCKGLEFCKFNNNKSGATMAWDHFYPNAYTPVLLKYIEDRDLWLKNMPEADDVAAYIQSWPQNFKTLDMLEAQFDSTTGIQVAADSGKAIGRFKNTLVDIMTRHICIAQVGGFDIPVVNATVLASEVTNKLCKDWPQYPFSASYADDTKTALRNWRLTSIGEFDVSEIAKIYGGGGHRNAAGFTQVLNPDQVEQA